MREQTGRTFEAECAMVREEARVIRETGKDARTARAILGVVSRLEAAYQEGVRRWVDIQEAMRITGLSHSHLRLLQRNGVLTNPGRKGAPRFVIEELLRHVKSGHRVPPEYGGPAEDAAAVDVSPKLNHTEVQFTPRRPRQRRRTA